MSEIRELIRDDQQDKRSRARGSFEANTVKASLKVPAGMSKEDQKIKKIADNIRKIHPEMADFPGDYLAAQPLDVLMKAARDSVNAETANLGKRHYTNYTKARANPVTVPRGLDNRSSILHEARFLPGAAVKGSELWLNARRVWGPQGVEAICNYDVTAMGMAGCINAKGMEALHNPGTQEISVKMFTISNVRLETPDSWKEMNDMNELRIAYRNMKKAAFMIRPWDYSFVVLEAWLNPTDWLFEELEGYQRAAILGDFIDLVLSINASNWVQEIPYMDLENIEAQWVSWWGFRKSSAPRDPKTAEEGSGRGVGSGWRGDSQSSYKPMPPFDTTVSENNICPFYNLARVCRNKAHSCVLSRNRKPTRMYHRCNHVTKKGTNGENELCMRSHPQYEH